MHFKNGRLAAEGDPVISHQYNRVVAGTLHSLSEGSTTCNAILARPVPGGIDQRSVTVGDCYHAEDAFAAVEAKLASAEATTVASTK